MIKRNFIRNAVSLLFCSVVLFSQDALGDIVCDIDSNVYRTVTIKGQEWMGENLSVKHYRNGDPIYHAATATEWEAASRRGEGAWCYYSNNQKYGNSHGILYNWYAINDPRGLAPEGWQVPDDSDWNSLSSMLGGRSSAGAFLKAGAKNGLGPSSLYSSSATFRALPAGYRRNDGRFYYMNTNAYFWSSTSFIDGFAWFHHLNASNDMVFRNDTSMGNGMSVRCVRDRGSFTMFADRRISSSAEIVGNELPN